MCCKKTACGLFIKAFETLNKDVFITAHYTTQQKLANCFSCIYLPFYYSYYNHLTNLLDISVANSNVYVLYALVAFKVF